MGKYDENPRKENAMQHNPRRAEYQSVNNNLSTFL